MRPDELKAIAVELYGEKGHIALLAKNLGVERTQVWRYLNGRASIPGPVAAAATCWIKVFREKNR